MRVKHVSITNRAGANDNTVINSRIWIAADIPEFDAWRCVPMAELPALVVPFKRDVYESVVAAFAPLIRG